MTAPLFVVPLIGTPQGAEWLILLVLVVLLFGAKKLPELARGSGRALRIFKAETKGLDDDDDDARDAGPPAVGKDRSGPAAVPFTDAGDLTVDPQRDVPTREQTRSDDR